MTLLIFSVALVLGVSALCSLTEAAVYAVRMPYIRELTESGSTAGGLLTRFKRRMEEPITAILIVNTVANTAGAAIAGAQARQLFGEASIIWFVAAFTLAVLFFSEIVPKVIGVTYSRSVARAVSVPLNAAIVALYPLVWFIQRITRAIKPAEPVPDAPEEEIRQMVTLGAEEGSILPFESELVKNVLQLDEVKAQDIMTPRTVVFTLRANRTVKEVSEAVTGAPFARIPIHAPDDPENWVGVVLRADILTSLAKDKFDTTLQSLCKPLGFVPEQAPGHRLLDEFIKRREHLLGVVDEYGVVLGVVTLEDVFEALIGREIVDETDAIVDLQAVARRRARRRLKRGDS